MQYWYALHTKPHKERQAAEHLRRHDVPVYLPLIRVNPVNPRASRERAFFPGYLFASMDLNAVGIGRLQWTPGLRGVVQFGGQPASVPGHVIRELERRVDHIREAGGLVLAGLRPGDPVRITSGPFAGYDAVFDLRLKDSERVRVLLTMLQRRVKLELHVGEIRKLRQA